MGKRVSHGNILKLLHQEPAQNQKNNQHFQTFLLRSSFFLFVFENDFVPYFILTFFLHFLAYINMFINQWLVYILF